jgi:hypothetical protein
MINTVGAAILVLLYHAGYAGGATMHEFETMESCEYALEQIKERRLRMFGFCIDKEPE